MRHKSAAHACKMPYLVGCGCVARCTGYGLCDPFLSHVAIFKVCLRQCLLQATPTPTSSLDVCKKSVVVCMFACCCFACLYMNDWAVHEYDIVQVPFSRCATGKQAAHGGLLVSPAGYTAPQAGPRGQVLSTLCVMDVHGVRQMDVHRVKPCH